MPPRKPSFVVKSEPRLDGQLSIVEVSEKECVLSTGEVLYLKYEKSRLLAEQMCQEQAPIHGLRTWFTKDGNELIELHRGETFIASATVAPPKTSTVF